MLVVTLSLDKIFNPRNVAVVGASDEEGTVGARSLARLWFGHKNDRVCD